MSDQFAYSDRDSSGHIPSAHDFSRSNSSSHAAAFPAVTQLFPKPVSTTSVQQNTAIQKQNDNSSGVAQLDKDELLMLSLILAALMSTPELLGMWGFIGTFAFILLVDSLKGDIDNRTAIEKVGPLCNKLGIAPQELIDHLNNENVFNAQQIKQFEKLYNHDPEQQEQNKNLKDKGLNPWVYHGLVPSILIDDLTGNDSKKLDTIFERLNNYTFTYAGDYVSGLEGFMRKTGDCRTLAEMFVTAAEAAGIKGVKIIPDENAMLVEPKNIHGRGTIGNVAGGLWWYFGNHFTCGFKGRKYDLLFMTKTPPETHHILSSKEYKYTGYMIFSNNWCMIPKSEARGPMEEDVKGKLGIAMEGEDSVKRYIDNHPHFDLSKV